MDVARRIPRWLSVPVSITYGCGPTIRIRGSRYSGAGRDLFHNYFPKKNEELDLDGYNGDGKNIPYRVTGEFLGKELPGIEYEPLIPWIKPMGDAFRVISGDYVTTEDGTGIVHIAPTFGADDDRVAKQQNIAPLVVVDKAGQTPADGRSHGQVLPDGGYGSRAFVASNVDAEAYREYEGRFVKNAYDPKLTDATRRSTSRSA